MINVSNEYRKTIIDNRRFLLKANLTFPSGEKFELSDADIFQSGMSFDDATSNNNSLQIGYAYIGSHKLILDNFDGKYDEYDFTGAIVVPYVGLKLSEKVEYIKKGLFTVDDPGTGGNVITLDCLDNMHRFERPFSEVEVVFPVSAQLLLTAICTHCGVPLATPTFDNDDYIINERPIDDALSCLDMISYIAQVAGCYARCNVDGELELKWYNTSVFEQSHELDGGIFDIELYSSGIDVDGGNFIDYSSGYEFDAGTFQQPQSAVLDGGLFEPSTSYQTGDVADGGTFVSNINSDEVDGGTFDQMKRYHHFYDFSSTPTISVDDVVITGIKVNYAIEDETYTTLHGTEGYVLSIEDNPLIQSSADANTVANVVGSKIVGMKLRPFTANVLSDPSVEAGDPCYVSIRTARGYVTYQSFITALNYTVGQRMMVRSDAETPSRNSSKRYSETTKTIVEARKLVKEERNARQQAIDNLANALANSSGLYKTEEGHADGSTIYYFHDKPTKSESQIIWKFVAEAIAVSTDGGNTYPIGIEADGDAILNRIYAIGIDATYLTTGIIQSEDGSIAINLKDGTFTLKDKNGQALLTSNGVANSDNFSAADNVANGYPLRIHFNLDENVSQITNVLLKWTIDKFRTYSTTASVGGEVLATSSTNPTYIGALPMIIVNQTTAVAVTDGELHSHEFNASHTDVISDPGHGHQFTLPPHTHALNFGIMETPVTDNTINIYVDGTHRATLNEPQGVVDLTSHITTSGWHTIELHSSTLKRISAQVNVKSYIRS